MIVDAKIMDVAKGFCFIGIILVYIKANVIGEFVSAVSDDSAFGCFFD